MRSTMLTALRETLPERAGVAVIHSSFANLAPPEGFSPWDAVAALDGLVRDGWTVALPAFTFSFCGGAPFDPQASRSEVGALADWALERLPGARRTGHPIYSFVIAGPEAEALAACAGETTFGPGSPFELFEARDATLVMLGCDWSFCTQLHRYEELAQVPYRYFKTFEGEIGEEGRRRPIAASMFVRDLDIDPQNDFSPAFDSLRDQGRIRERALWRGRVQTASTQALAETCRRQLAADPLAHVANAPTVAYRIARRAEAESAPPLRIAVLGHGTLANLTAALRAELAPLAPGRRLELYEAPFGQMDREIIDPASNLAGFKPDITVFADRLEDLAGVASLDEAEPDALREQVEGYAALIARHAAAHQGWSIVCRFARLTSSVDVVDPRTGDPVDAANRTLEQALAGLDQCAWVEIAAIAARHDGPACDDRLWRLGRFPFAEGFTRRLAQRFAGLALAAIGKTARVIAVDLDNTLWGGVLGEDGAEGLQLGGDYPGGAFSAFQRMLKRLSQRGIGLVVTSKNDADLALGAIDSHPEMVLRSADLIGHRIDWRPKWLNVQELCDELGLGVESVLFIDDNPVEREAMRRNLPGVKVLELPEDPTGYATSLADCPWIAALAVTAEDAKRTERYRQRARVEEQRRSATSLEDFYASLGMVLHLQPLSPETVARADQLGQKTNQFNTTTRRHGKAALARIDADDGQVVVIGLADRFGARENIGLLTLTPDPEHANWGMVDGYLLSCRVLGRGLETAILHWALGFAARRGWKGLRGEVIETERNAPARGVFEAAGFAREASGLWARETSNAPALPDWLGVDDRIAATRPVLAGGVG